jgi:hypothetical protein
VAESRQAHKSRRHSAFVVSSHGKSAGQIVVAPAWRTVPVIERGACGLPRERTAEGLHSSVVAGSGGGDERRSWRRSQ